MCSATGLSNQDWAARVGVLPHPPQEQESWGAKPGRQSTEEGTAVLVAGTAESTRKRMILISNSRPETI